MEKEMLPKMDLFKDLKFLVFNQQLAMARVSLSVAAISTNGPELGAQGNSQNHVLDALLIANMAFKGDREVKGSQSVV